MLQESSPSSYYAIFDGHAGSDAAAYSSAHLHQFVAESQFYPAEPERALKDAFLRTDEFFLEKCRIEVRQSICQLVTANFTSITTSFGNGSVLFSCPGHLMARLYTWYISLQLLSPVTRTRTVSPALTITGAGLAAAFTNYNILNIVHTVVYHTL